MTNSLTAQKRRSHGQPRLSIPDIIGDGLLGRALGKAKGGKDAEAAADAREVFASILPTLPSRDALTGSSTRGVTGLEGWGTSAAARPGMGQK